MPAKVPIIVLLGIDQSDRPHASRFDTRDAALVQHAAELMGFHMIRVPPGKTELHALAETLPVGKLFATGRAFAPYVARPTFDKLAVLVTRGVTLEQRDAAGVHPVFPLAKMFTTKAINIADALWAKIVLGTVVLASQGANRAGGKAWL